ncbi:MAG TPA: hypothetical protein VGK02_00645 [Candidatus Aquicultor sp.]
MTAEFITPDDKRWVKFLEQTTYDFYHLPEYVELTAQYEGGMPVAFYAEAGDYKFLAPLLIRGVPAVLEAPHQWYDAASPYGYPTPLITPFADAPALDSFFRSFKEVGVQSGIVSAFFRLHPLLSLPTEQMAQYGLLVAHGQTVYIDLSQSMEELWTQKDRDHKRDIKRLVGAGFSARIDDWDLYDSFIAHYRETMERVSASESYFFPNSYFYDFKSVLGSACHLCSVLTDDGNVASSVLFTTVNGIVQYHLSATLGAYNKLAPSKLAFETACIWSKEHGNKYAHLGGGVGGKKDSLFRYKSGFSKRRADFYTFRMILEGQRYADLTNRWRNRVQPEGLSDDFFPDYRKNCA